MDEISSRIRVFCDSASLQDMRTYVDDPMVKGFTSNPTLARNAGIDNYLDFAYGACSTCSPKEVSVEVIADDNRNMLRQAHLLNEIGKNISIKIPVTNSQGIPTVEVIEKLAIDKCYMNITAVFSIQQSIRVLEALKEADRAILSVFAGRIADTGVDPVPHFREIVSLRNSIAPNVSLLWASPREPLNLVHAIMAGADIITMTPALISKLSTFGKDLDDYSLETVQMFTNDASRSGFVL